MIGANGTVNQSANGLSAASAAVLTTSNLTLAASSELRVALAQPVASDAVLVQGDATVKCPAQRRGGRLLLAAWRTWRHERFQSLLAPSPPGC